MKIIGIEEEENQIKKISKKKVIIASIIATSIITIIVLAIVYSVNKDFRDFWDKYVLMKDVSENNLPSISMDGVDSSHIYAYDKYIVILQNNVLTAYNSSGKQEYTQDMQITNPIADHKGRFLLIGDKGEQMLYLMEGNKKVWEKKQEGNISRVAVNKNGTNTNSH